MNEKMNVPKVEDLSPKSQTLLNNIKKSTGKVINMLATIGYSENALQSYSSFSKRNSSLSLNDKEIINIFVSELNDCDYCVAAHAAKAKELAGFSDERITAVRKADFSDTKEKALAALVKEVVENKGSVTDSVLKQFFEAGYTNENLVDVLLLIVDRTFTNYIHSVTNMPIDFPEQPKL